MVQDVIKEQTIPEPEMSTPVAAPNVKEAVQAVIKDVNTPQKQNEQPKAMFPQTGQGNNEGLTVAGIIALGIAEIMISIGLAGLRKKRRKD